MKEIKVYSQIQQLKSQGFKKEPVAKLLHMSKNTVRKYWNMTPDEYVALAEIIRKSHTLAQFEPVILKWLYEHPSMSAAQVHDWLLEHYKIKTAERTTRRLVELLRETHKIKKASIPRSYEAVDELPMGYQMQVDFGQKHLRTPDGQYVKVHFVGFVLSHSRYKWGYFKDKPFTSGELVQSLHGCFDYMGGKPCELVFDQDSIVSVDENYGDIMFTYEFEQFKQSEKLDVYLCRKADPESKGKVESVVKFIKINFLENRFYMGLDLLNQSFEAWLERTGNAKVHGTTKKVPAKVFLLEQEHLRPVLPTKLSVCEESITRSVRKDNTVLYQSNRYSVPQGTFGKDEEVILRIDGEKLVIEQVFGDYVIAEHTISKEKGKLIKLPAHRKDHAQSASHRLHDLCEILGKEYHNYFETMRTLKPRYFKDQSQLVLELVHQHTVTLIKESINYCMSLEIYSATDLRDTVIYLKSQKAEDNLPDVVPTIKTITNPKAAAVITQKRSIKEYERVGGSS
ncbi:MAG: IS21 family transposase [Desulfosporosinus sp.]|nr:IS21 family transposase [Desulfosporosinus sp.]MCO5387671.1 IS21 family transposase [Desulfosporosinus sp.]MCO5388294.1 IS21 family transposase [Desulfosporosinus sp.]